MSNLPDPIPAPENNAPVAPRLTLTPKPPAPVATPMVAPAAAPSSLSAEAAPAAAYAPTLAPAAVLVPKPSLRLQANPGVDAKLPGSGTFTSPMPKIDAAADAVHPAFAVIAGLAAAAAVTFAVLLFIKSQ